jgi:hypothetical protein
VSYVWDSVISVDPGLRYPVEHVVISDDKDNIYYKLSVYKFNMKQHFSQVCSNHKFVEKAFLKVQKFLKHLKLEESECHDLSRYKNS